MWPFLDRFRGNRSTPIRRKGVVFVHRDSKGNEHVSWVHGEETTLSPDGSPDTIELHSDETYPCLHPLHHPFGGRCADCGALSCERCHTHCENQNCNKPICPACAKHLPVKDQVGGTLCRACAESVSRQRRIGGALSFLIAPFVERAARD